MFIDRDGTIIVHRTYLSEISAVQLISGAVDGLRVIQSLGLPIVLVTNQSAIARGIIDEAQLELIHVQLRSLLSQAGIQMSGEYYCPHIPEDRCICRKPSHGMLVQAESDLNIDVHNSFMIGDNTADIEFGMAAFMTTFLVRTGYGQMLEQEGDAHPDYVVDDIHEAAKIISILHPSHRQ